MSGFESAKYEPGLQSDLGPQSAMTNNALQPLNALIHLPAYSETLQHLLGGRAT